MYRLAHYFEREGARCARAPQSERHCRTHLAADKFDRLLDRHLFCCFAVDAHHGVAATYAGGFCRAAFERRNHGQRAVARAEFHPHPAERARDVFIKLLGIRRGEEDRVRVAIAIGQARDGAVDALLVGRDCVRGVCLDKILVQEPPRPPKLGKVEVLRLGA